MKQIRIPLREIDTNGQTLQWDEQTIWTNPLTEFHLPCKIIEPIQAEVFVLPEKEGCLFRGKITGKVVLPCDRCAEENSFIVHTTFDEFEEYPQSLEQGFDAKVSGKGFSTQSIVLENMDEEELWGENRVLILEDGVTYVDFGALLWEEFVLALPTKPLCRKDCKGICPTCGKNLNDDVCVCEEEVRDPRMSALFNLKIQ